MAKKPTLSAQLAVANARITELEAMALKRDEYIDTLVAKLNARTPTPSTSVAARCTKVRISISRITAHFARGTSQEAINARVSELKIQYQRNVVAVMS